MSEEWDSARERILDCLRELADEAFQRRVWMASSGPEVSSFVEAVCGLFDDTGLGRHLDRQNSPPMFDANIDSRLRQFGLMVDRIDGSLAPESIIDDPQMPAIRIEAAQLIEMIENHDRAP